MRALDASLLPFYEIGSIISGKAIFLIINDNGEQLDDDKKTLTYSLKIPTFLTRQAKTELINEIKEEILRNRNIKCNKALTPANSEFILSFLENYAISSLTLLHMILICELIKNNSRYKSRAKNDLNIERKIR